MSMTFTQRLKLPIREFLKQYPNDRLAGLLAHAQDEKLSFQSCCCLIGCINAPHALQGHQSSDNLYSLGNHVAILRLTNPLAREAELAYDKLGRPDIFFESLLRPNADALRRRILIPMIRAEMRSRAHEAEASRESEPVEVLTCK